MQNPKSVYSADGVLIGHVQAFDDGSIVNVLDAQFEFLTQTRNEAAADYFLRELHRRRCREKARVH